MKKSEDQYVIYFEIYGKKMKTTVIAKSEEDAKKQIIQQIKFDKIIRRNPFVDDYKENPFSRLMDLIK